MLLTFHCKSHGAHLYQKGNYFKGTGKAYVVVLNNLFANTFTVSLLITPHELLFIR